MSRRQQSLGAPPEELAGFPDCDVPDELARVCRTGAGTWWYGNSGVHRFDLPRDSGRGTCYFATDEFAALRETFRAPVLASDLDRFELRVVSMRRDRRRLADTTSRQAAAFGVTKEICTTLDYELTQRWAARFAEHFDGVRHELRHDPRPAASGVSLFGPAGQDASRSNGRHRKLTRAMLAAAGLRVIDRPVRAALRVVDDP